MPKVQCHLLSIQNSLPIHIYYIYRLISTTFTHKQTKLPYYHENPYTNTETPSSFCVCIISPILQQHFQAKHYIFQPKSPISPPLWHSHFILSRKPPTFAVCCQQKWHFLTFKMSQFPNSNNSIWFFIFYPWFNLS